MANEIFGGAVHAHKVRYHLLDALRALAIISMIIYHAMWDAVNIFGADIPWYNGTAGYVWQQSICWTFIFLSGFCCIFSRSPMRSGIIVSLAGLIVTAVTLIAMPESRVIFGVLTLLGACMIFAAAVKRSAFIMRNSLTAFAVCAVLFFLTRDINRGFLGFERLHLISLPKSLYSGMIAAFFGFTDPHFYSSDYFSFFPWCFLFFMGFFLSAFFKQKDAYPKFLRKKLVPLDFLGRHSLIIYLLHQPILYLCFSAAHFIF